MMAVAQCHGPYSCINFSARGRQTRRTTPPLCGHQANGNVAQPKRRQILSVPGGLYLSAVAVGLRDRSDVPAGYQSIGQAIRSVPDGTIINIGPGTYRERLILDGPSITLQASPEGSDVTIIHETEKPYEATVYATSGSCTLRGLKIAHRSPSVANNYAVFAQGANLTLEDCDITSATGSGVGLEGGQLTVSGCNIHRCKQHGIALFNSLEDGEGHALVRNTSVSDNGLEGVLVRDGASLEADSVKATHNAGHGFNLSSGSGLFRSCTSSANGKGAILMGDDFESESAETQIASK